MTARWDFGAIAGTAVVVVMTITYLVIIDAQDSDPAYWFVVLLLVVASAGLYAARKDSPHRKRALLAGAVLLFGLGLVSLPSIGLALVVGAACLFASGLRRDRAAVGTVPDPGWGHDDEADRA